MSELDTIKTVLFNKHKGVCIKNNKLRTDILNALEHLKTDTTINVSEVFIRSLEDRSLALLLNGLEHYSEDEPQNKMIFRSLGAPIVTMGYYSINRTAYYDDKVLSIVCVDMSSNSSISYRYEEIIGGLSTCEVVKENGEKKLYDVLYFDENGRCIDHNNWKAKISTLMDKAKKQTKTTHEFSQEMIDSINEDNLIDNLDRLFESVGEAAVAKAKREAYFLLAVPLPLDVIRDTLVASYEVLQKKEMVNPEAIDKYIDNIKERVGTNCSIMMSSSAIESLFSRISGDPSVYSGYALINDGGDYAIYSQIDENSYAMLPISRRKAIDIFNLNAENKSMIEKDEFFGPGPKQK